MRASDVDRDRVAPVLNDALATDKFEERLTVVYSAKTLGELAGLTGRWVVPVELSVTAAFGKTRLDLRDATL
ncbi:DUF1707 domain-containing protein [Nonomuraea sp. NPDC050202]|uniref:DUF1707 SHOCT-like domain-containing protein n=1 Tax=Nonomuraea sp. NPDC050202 TaxID=3155035 RepID=UPI0033C0FBB4